MYNCIASERIRRGMNQDDLAEKMGVSRWNVVQWEKRPDEIPYRTLVSLSELFGCSPEYLVSLTDERLPKGADGRA